jgi:hypothetical protein
VDCQQAILSYLKKQSCLLPIDKTEPNPFVPTATGIIAIVSDSEDFYKSTIVHISYLTDFNKSEISRLSLDSEIAILSCLKKQSCLLPIDKTEPNLHYFFCKYNAQVLNTRQFFNIIKYQCLVGF